MPKPDSPLSDLSLARCLPPGIVCAVPREAALAALVSGSPTQWLEFAIRMPVAFCACGSRDLPVGFLGLLILRTMDLVSHHFSKVLFMKFSLRFLGGVGVLLSCSLVACTTMTPQQAEGVELRRYCEQNKNDPVKCVGFYGFM